MSVTFCWLKSFNRDVVLPCGDWWTLFAKESVAILGANNASCIWVKHVWKTYNTNSHSWSNSSLLHWNDFLVFLVKSKIWIFKPKQKKSHSTLRAKRATFTFWVDKSSLKRPKIKNSNATFWVIFKHCACFLWSEWNLALFYSYEFANWVEICRIVLENDKCAFQLVKLECWGKLA